MRIVVDLQGAQSGSRFRGIGRYSLALATAMARNARGHDIHVVLNGRFEDSIDPIREAFGDSLAPENFHVWLPARTGALQGSDRADELIRDAFIASLAPDVVHVSSLFEGLGEPAIVSVGVGRVEAPTAVTLFDLIPLIYRKPYLDDVTVARWYFNKLAHLRRADLLLGISASATREAVDHLHFDPASVVNISSACDGGVARVGHAPIDEAEVRRRYRLTRPFVMYTGGIDHRKNIEGLVRAFALMPDTLRRSHQLAIVCAVRDEAREELMNVARQHGLHTDDVVLTGFVDESDLVSLYNLCALFVFPSWHEGFGLPALEAMQCGAPVIGANTSSLPEVIGLEEALFDPRSDRSIAEKMEQALTDSTFRQRLVDHAAVQASRFSWDESARRAITAMEELVSGSARSVPASRSVKRRPRLAYVSPLPPQRSGIADYSAQLVPELARHYDIDVIVAQPYVSDLQVAGVTAIRGLEWFEQNGAMYDRVLYHFGNSEFHAHMPDMLQRTPGVIVLHDFFLSGLHSYRDLVLGHHGVWAHELYRSHGYAPLPRRIDGDHEALRQDFPCNFSVLAMASNVLVHSSYSLTLCKDWYGQRAVQDWKIIPLVRTPARLSSEGRRSAREKLGLPTDGFVVCSFGFMAPSKMNLCLLEAWFATALSREPNAYLIFVGQAERGPYGAEVEKLIASHPAGRRVRITGYADAETFQDYLQAADLAVQLRTSSRGETSAAVLDALNHALPTVVNANGALADLPRDAVRMLPDKFSVAELAASLQELHDDPDVRARLGAAGRALIVDHHSPRHCAQMYYDALESSYAQRDGLLGELAESLSMDGMVVEERELGRSLAWSFPPPGPARQVLVEIPSGMADSAFQAALRHVVLHPPAGVRVEPVRWCETERSYLYARAYTLGLIGCPQDLLEDEPVDVRSGDLLLSGPGGLETIRSRSVVWRGAIIGTFFEWFDGVSAAGTAVSEPQWKDQ